MGVEECEPYANQVMAFYVASLPDVVGHGWQPPSLSFLASYWLHSSGSSPIRFQSPMLADLDIKLTFVSLDGPCLVLLSIDCPTRRLSVLWNTGNTDVRP